MARAMCSGLFFALACAPENKAPDNKHEASEAFSAQFIESIDTEFSRVLQEGSAPESGAAITVVHRSGGVLLERYYGNWRRDEPFFLASLSKVVAAGILLRLEERGLVRLDAPIDVLGFAREDGRSPSIAQLLSNASGLKCPRNSTQSSRWDCQFNNEDRLLNCAHGVWESHTKEALLDPPDREFCYGGAQWQLAGAAAELASGQSWSELFESIYEVPCALENSGFTNQYGPDSDPRRRWADYPHSFSTRELSANPNIEGGMFSTVPDFSKLLLMLLRGGECAKGRVLFEESVRKMREDRIWNRFQGSISKGFASADLEAFGRGYGLGWWVKRSTQERIVPGAYGSTAWISGDGSFAALIAMKADGVRGRQIFVALNPRINEAMARYPRPE